MEWYGPSPELWDLLTFVRLVGLAFSIAIWLAVGRLVSPWIYEWFDGSTTGYVNWMVETFDAMFMTVTPRRCVVYILSSGAAFGCLGLWLTSGLPEGIGYAILRGLIAAFLVFGPFKIPLGMNLPRFIVRRMWTRRIETFEDQLLDGLSFLSNGLKSGLSVLQAMEMVKEELPAPISQEFGVVLDEQRVGLPLEEALLNLERRVDTEDVQILVTSINILRQSGGNLAETFDTISYTIRERKKVEGKIKSITAQGVAQGVIIVLLPFGLAAALYMMEPVLISRLWTTGPGWGIIFTMLFMQTVGALMIRKIVNIDV